MILFFPFRRRVQDDPLLSIGDVLFVLTGQHAFDGFTTEIGRDGLNGIGDVKVLDGGFDKTHLNKGEMD